MFSAERIRELLALLNDRLAREDVTGELYLVGGAVMTLAFAARPATNDVDAVFVPTDVVRRLARLVADDAGVERYFPPTRIPAKTRYALEEILGT